jgi:hypothetical protein
MARPVDAGGSLEIEREAGATVVAFTTPILSSRLLDEFASTLEIR